MSPGAFPWQGWGGGCLVFQLTCHIHRYWAYSSKSTVWPKVESCFQDGTCSVFSFNTLTVDFLKVFKYYIQEQVRYIC